MNAYGERGERETKIFTARVAAYEALFVSLKSQLRVNILKECGPVAAEAVSKAHLNRSKLRLVVDRYLNDLKRLKEMHIDIANAFEDSEKRLHRSKIAAYSMKWILQEHPVHYIEELEDYDLVPNYAKAMLDDLNLLFGIEIIFYHLNFLDAERQHFKPGEKYSRVLHDLSYYIKTGFYNEKMAALLFDSMYYNSPEGLKETVGEGLPQ